MATIHEAIQAYRLHRSRGILNELNNLFQLHGHSRKITHQMAIDIFEGAHQARLPYEKTIHYSKTINDYSKALRSSTLMTSHYKDFEDLHDDVKFYLTGVKGIGFLTRYDIALRIGFIREEQILPEKKVYLSRGALLGANNLYKTNPSLFKFIPTTKKGVIKENPYDITMFDPVLQKLTSAFLEDFFCVFHKELKKLSSLSYKDLQKSKKSTFRNHPFIIMQ